jgi:hypothetical protein
MIVHYRLYTQDKTACGIPATLKFLKVNMWRSVTCKRCLGSTFHKEVLPLLDSAQGN